MLGQETANRCRSSVEVDAGEEQLVAGKLDVVGDANVADVFGHCLLGISCARRPRTRRPAGACPTSPVPMTATFRGYSSTSMSLLSNARVLVVDRLMPTV